LSSPRVWTRSPTPRSACRWARGGSPGAISLPLGAGRLTRDLLADDLPKPKDIKAARAYVRAEIGGAVRELLRFGPPTRAVGTSKTIRSLARIAGAAPSGEGIYVTRRLRREHLGDIVKRLGRRKTVAP